MAPGDPIYLRWDQTRLPHREFYEVEIESSLFLHNADSALGEIGI